MDMMIRQNRASGLIVSIYDKRLDAKYANIRVIRYPNVNSVLATVCKTGIITSQMHRFWRLCTKRTDFAYNVALVLHRMHNKGYSKAQCASKVRGFFTRFSQIYGGRPLCKWLTEIRHKLCDIDQGRVRPGPFGPVRV
jgi:hypothetical protein